ncbi:MAG: phenylacetate--CoA ligase, partial [SAR324 cluster bacterium]|nr:phenylacetate--CoA ligase [SAR324 cluster bacterium]
MKVLSEPRDEEPSAEVLEDIVSNLVSHIKNRIGVTAKVKLVAKGGIERSAGKARRIVDKRPKN